MNVRFADRRPEGPHALAIPLTAGKVEAARLAGLSADDAAFIARAAAAAKFEGEAGALADLYAGNGRILLVGLGDGDSDKVYEKAGGALIAKVQTSEKTLVVDFSGHKTSGARAAALAFGAVMRNWRYDVYRTKLKAAQKPQLDEIVIVGAGEGAAAAWASAKALADGVAFTKELVTEPANIIYPESFVERCQKLKDLGVEITVLDDKQMADLGMGGLLGVAQGSRKPARLLVMRWKGADKEPVAFVGKGVTFDTGGISIKPAAGMEDMKWDMGGAGAVAGAMMALAGRKAKAHVIGVCGLVENMPDGNAQRPGDVVTSMSGQTIEVINTDAEGRLVLCDAITWVQKTHGVKTIVDLATLTGAMIVSLGNEYGGLFSNDDGLADKLLKAGETSGDKMWRFPLGDAYDKLIDSPIADMKNVGPRGGGSITAAQFIKRFVEDGVKWAHLDIAGMVWSAKAGATWDKGATGFGVRILDRFVADNLEA
ncbi:leucyl aminopeptidase [Sphingomonas sp. CGMCC 1.13654]|uniref:Probable cytosol aminopeptidase n=1 Tax=Sphingomonas chungangi TaxID=2683589 RepID=A0A838LAF0_9SPHN|nr:leucyl aminopeptidase [Sphingomonas chungangi]MBA2935812.1 leucyl aminopeptidase [Sphingomonas chungangi]MVW54503.1 leucyl aminopeptidase [Sphingomonas chungangi]